MTKQEEINQVLEIVETLIKNDTAYFYDCVYTSKNTRNEDLAGFQNSIREWLTDFPHHFVSYSKLSGRVLFKSCLYQCKCFVC